MLCGNAMHALACSFFFTCVFDLSSVQVFAVRDSDGKIQNLKNREPNSRIHTHAGIYRDAPANAHRNENTMSIEVGAAAFTEIPDEQVMHKKATMSFSKQRANSANLEVFPAGESVTVFGPAALAQDVEGTENSIVAMRNEVSPANSFESARDSFNEAFKELSSFFDQDTSQLKARVDTMGRLWKEGAQSRSMLKQEVINTFKKEFGLFGPYCTKNKGKSQDKDIKHIKQLQQKISKKQAKMKDILNGKKINGEPWKTTKPALEVAKQLKKVEYCVAAAETGCYHYGGKYCVGEKEEKYQLSENFRNYLNDAEEWGEDKTFKKWYDNLNQKVFDCLTHSQEYDDYMNKTKCSFNYTTDIASNVLLQNWAADPTCNTRCPKDLTEEDLVALPKIIDSGDLGDLCKQLMVPGSFAWKSSRVLGKCGRNGPHDSCRKALTNTSYQNVLGYQPEYHDKKKTYGPCCCNEKAMYDPRKDKCTTEKFQEVKDSKDSPEIKKHWFLQQRVGKLVNSILGDECDLGNKKFYVHKRARKKIHINLGGLLRQGLEVALFKFMYDGPNVSTRAVQAVGEQTFPDEEKQELEKAKGANDEEMERELSEGTETSVLQRTATLSWHKYLEIERSTTHVVLDSLIDESLDAWEDETSSTDFWPFVVLGYFFWWVIYQVVSRFVVNSLKKTILKMIAISVKGAVPAARSGS
eukprot:gnl/MRDRNA2_/MRDRNA2_82738_c0_seq4.p1 gnl/MRDRNA2_/MRDRNA2_82738_c0~~gnl/MRDRNA2_/MRDRNA2_82738_c0_seq4.p1  ORF type:complete len:695 (+),score=141.42 gnl/MRDRNA2_/MRDRNA2_82738_c0_seq4:128-2212(+)